MPFTLKGRVEIDEDLGEVLIHFPRYKVEDFVFSLTGSVQRKLRLKDEQKVKVTIG